MHCRSMKAKYTEVSKAVGCHQVAVGCHVWNHKGQNLWGSQNTPVRHAPGISSFLPSYHQSTEHIVTYR
jgi:hypothetical protein